MSVTEPTVSGLQSVPRTAAQVRVITAALDLFAQHGVNGTSLQMIADAIGVTKAAVYHQFKTKDEIVLAAVEVDLVKVEAALDAAETEKDVRHPRELVLTQVIDLAMARRRIVTAVQHDPGDRQDPGEARTVPPTDGASLHGADRPRRRHRRAGGGHGGVGRDRRRGDASARGTTSTTRRCAPASWISPNSSSTFPG